MLDACRNELSDIKSIASLHALVTLKLDQNAIPSLKDIEYKKMTRLATLRSANPTP